MDSPERYGASITTALNPPLRLEQVCTVLPNLSAPQLDCARVWIDKANLLQDYTFTLTALVERMWGLTRQEATFAKLRIYGPFTVEWVQQTVPDLSTKQIMLVQWLAEHNRLVMERRDPITSSSYRMPFRLILPDLLFASLDISPSQRKRAQRLFQPLCALWNPFQSYPYINAEQLWEAAASIGEQRRWHLIPRLSRRRPVTLDQILGIFPRLALDALEKARKFIQRPRVCHGWKFLSLEDVVTFLERHGCTSEMDAFYARHRLGIGGKGGRNS